MNSEILRHIFKAPFDYKTYCNEIVHRLFDCNDVASRPELLDTNAEGDQSYFIGQMDDTEGRLLGFFYTQVAAGSDVRRKRVGLRKLISPYLKYDVDGAIAVFDDGRHWRLSYICDLKEGSTSAKRFSYIMGDEQGQYKTPLERLEKIARLNGRIKLSDLKESFSVDALSDEFFDEYHIHYDRIVAELARQGKSGAVYHDYVKKLMGRIVFLYFLQKKGWLCGDTNFMYNTFLDSNRQNDYLESVLEPLFFGILNTEPAKREQVFIKNGWQQRWVGKWASIPYLNGGLFERDAVDELKIVLPKHLFEDLFRFFASYNFTVDENDPDDAEIGVDPEMLGKIFESLLEDNKAKGAFYTPKEIVRYMCKESLIAHLASKLPDVSDAVIRAFVETHEMQSELESYRDALSTTLREVKICDPAIGSGAFPMGLLNELWRCREALGTQESRLQLKKEIIENNIYGVDIERGAIDIARLRFWLSIVVDSEEPQPLPNFDYKFMQGNSLVESYGGYDLSRIAGKAAGRPSTATQYLIGLDSDLSRKNLHRLLREYFSVTDHQKKATMRQAINEEVKTLIRESVGGTPTFLSKLSALDPSANQEFFLWHTWFKDIFDSGGFDIVIANPPYVKEYTNRAAFDGFREMSPYYLGKMDLWYGFACHGIDFLKQGGLLCFIAQNNWTTSAGAKKMRNKVIKDTQILQMLDFNTYMVFENADIQTMIMLFKRTQSIDNYSFDYRIITQSNEKEDMLALLDKRLRNTKYLIPSINRKSLYDTLLTFSDNTQIVEKISRNKTYLQSAELGQGIVPALDDYFILTDIEKFDKSEREYIKPYFTGIRDRYVSYPLNKYLIYMSAKNYKSDNLNSLPNLKAHFEPHKFELMEAKVKYGTPNKPYFFVHRERDEKFFKEGVEKIVSQVRCKYPIFYYTTNAFYGSRALFFIQSKRWNMKFLVGVLNSKLISYWVQKKGKQQGEMLKLDKEPLQGIPLPIVNDSEQQLIISMVDKIIKAKSSNPTADTSSLEREIDEKVYELYGLSPEEIAVVEQ